jgi:hypothetical protein
MASNKLLPPALSGLSLTAERGAQSFLRVSRSTLSLTLDSRKNDSISINWARSLLASRALRVRLRRLAVNLDKTPTLRGIPHRIDRFFAEFSKLYFPWPKLAKKMKEEIKNFRK